MPMIPNDEYWSMRAAKRMHGYHTIADSAANEIAAAYIKSTNYINGEIRKIFGIFWEQSGLTETEARKLLKGAKDIKSLENLKKIIAKVGDADKRRRLMSIVQSPAYAYRIRRFEQLQKDIDVQTRYLADFEQNVTAEHYVDLANEAYNRAMFDIQKGTGVGFSFSRMPTSRIAEIIDRNWSGKMFSERIWGRASNINAVLQEELLVGFMTGRSGRKTAKMIEQRMGVGAMEARRLVRTESTYVANFAELESYKESGVSRYRYVATLDMRTSEVCQRLDGMEFDVADASPGENIPPMHPWCRSTTIAAMDSDILAKMKRRAKDPVTGEYTEVPADMTYAQWIKHVDENHGSGTWETERQKILKSYRAKRKNTTRAQNVVDNGAKSGIIKPRESKQISYKRFDINDQKGYDDWVNAYYAKNKPKLTKHDLAVLKEYTDGSYEAINAATRFEVGSEPYNRVCRQYGVNNLDGYKKISDDISTAIRKFDIDDDIICHRYVPDADYITGTTSSMEDLRSAIGKEYTEKGFMSTCLFEHLTKKFGGKTPIHLEIRIPKGTSGAYINDFSEKKNLEWEYLLDRGTRFRILEGGERKTIENKWVTAERAWKDVEIVEKYMILEVLQ